jgi:hypothetical protein
MPVGQVRIVSMLIIAGLGLVGCEDRQPAAPVATTPPVAQATAPATDGPPAWNLPAAWEQVPGEKPMRVATFRRANVENEEIVVSHFPGDVGGLLANVNRWRAQVGLGPVAEGDLAKELRPFDNGKYKGHLMRLRGEKQHMLAAIIPDPAANRTWFIKAATTPMAADTLEGDFDAFARSFGVGKASAGK